MEIKFLDTNNIVKLSQLTFHQEDVDIKNLINSKNKSNNNNASLTETEELQEKVLNSLNYVSNNGLLPSSLPDTLNIKFISNSLWDKLKVSLYGDPIAQLKIPNTIFISPQLLPHHIKDNNLNFTSNLNQYLKDKNQVFDFVLYHELAHLVFNHNSPEFNEMNKHILQSSDLINKLQRKLDIKSHYRDVPLYQINRSLEEHFADGYASLILKNKYNTEINNIVEFRNQGNPNLVSKGFNIDINRLGPSIKDIDKIKMEKGIDNAMYELYEMGLKGALAQVKKHYPYKPKMIDKLQDNLNKFKIKINEMESGISIINKAEQLITTKNQFKSFNMNNIEDRLNKLAPAITSQLKETSSNKPKL